MRYSVEIHFDQDSGERIRRVIAAVGQQLGVGVFNEFESRPHVSLAVLKDVDPVVLLRIVEQWAVRRCGFEMELSAVAAFPGDAGVVFVAPVISRELLEMQDCLYTALHASGLHVEGFYAPGKWVPHCTICTKAPGEMMGGIVDFIRQTMVFGVVSVLSVSVVAFGPAIELGAFQLTG